MSPLYEYREKDGRGLCYVYAEGKRIAAFQPTSDTYSLSGAPVPPVSWLLNRVSNAVRATDKITAWALHESRYFATVGVAALAFALISAIGLWFWMRAPLSAREVRICWQPMWRRAIAFALIPILLVVCTEARAQYQPPPEMFFYYHGDHLGSSNVTTDRAGNVLHQFEYKAFGAQRYAAPGNSVFSVTHGYTGQAYDDDTGLYYYNARYYDPELGRFTQADTVVPDPGNSQAFDRFAYCANNPVKYVDPSGHNPILIGIVIGAAIGGAMAAATGGNIGMGILCGAISGAFGGLGAVAGTALKIGALAGSVAGGAAGGAVTSAIAGTDVGMGALTGAISGAIGFGVGRATQGMITGLNIEETGWAELAELGGTTAGGALGGGVGAEIQGGDFWEGSGYGAAGGAMGYGLAYFLKWNNGPLLRSDRNVGHRLSQLIGKLWNLPNTAVGLVWGGIGKLTNWNAAEISVEHNSLKFSFHRLNLFGSITFGNSMSLDVGPYDYYRRDRYPVWAHEILHTYQAQQLGPLYLPSNILGQAVAGFIGIFTGYDYANQTFNWNERGPYRYETWH